MGVSKALGRLFSLLSCNTSPRIQCEREAVWCEELLLFGVCYVERHEIAASLRQAATSSARCGGAAAVQAHGPAHDTSPNSCHPRSPNDGLAMDSAGLAIASEFGGGFSITVPNSGVLWHEAPRRW